MSLFPDDRPRCAEHDEPLVQGSCYACVSKGASKPQRRSETVLLTGEQHARCLEVGANRDRRAVGSGWRPKYGQDAADTRENNLTGALGEGALAVHIGHWDRWSIAQDHAETWKRPDVADFYEVRSCPRGRNLTTHDGEEEPHTGSPFVLAWTDPAERKVILVGWLWWKDTMRLGVLQEHWRHPAYLTAYEDLNPMCELPPIPDAKVCPE